MFLGLGVLASTILLIEHPLGANTAALSSPGPSGRSPWAYYFAFYVIEHYIDLSLQICGTPVVLAICDPAEVDVRPRISGAAAI